MIEVFPPRGNSSVGQSSGLIIRWSQVQVLLAPLFVTCCDKVFKVYDDNNKSFETLANIRVVAHRWHSKTLYTTTHLSTQHQFDVVTAHANHPTGA